MRKTAKYIFLTALPLGTLVALIAYYAVDVPFWDEFGAVGILLKKFYAGTLTFADFFAQHNEHRIIPGKIIMFLNAAFNGWNICLEIAVNVLFAVGTSIVVFISIEDMHKLDGIKKSILYFTSAWLIFSFTQNENWTWGFQMQILMCVFFAVLSLRLLADDAVFSAMIPAVLATFSFGSGMMVWPAGMVVLLLRCLTAERRLKKAEIFFWLAASVAVICLYFYNYRYITGGLTFTEKFKFLLTHIYLPVILFLEYIGSPVSASRKSIALAASIIGFSIQVLCLWNYRRWDKNKCFWIGLDIFVMLCSAVTAFGRSGGLSAAMATRYISFGMLFWIATISLSAISLDEKFNLSWKHYVLPALIILSLSLSEEALKGARERNKGLSIFKAQISEGIFDEEIFTRYIYPDKSFALFLGMFKEHNLRNFQNAPGNIEFNGFRPCRFVSEDITDSDEVIVNILKFAQSSDGRWLNIAGNVSGRGSDKLYLVSEVILHNDTDAFITWLPEEEAHTGTKPVKYENPLNMHKENSFAGEKLYCDGLPEGIYHIVLKFTDRKTGRIYYHSLAETIRSIKTHE